jgi:GT2 family glycosyltransferase
MIASSMHKRQMSSERFSLAIIMPAFGNWGDTLECIEILANQTSKDFRLFLADDGSPQPPPQAVHAFAFVTYIRLNHRGFASTCNSAVALAAEAGHTHGLLLNNDTTFGLNFVESWLAKIASFPQAIMGPLIFYYDRPELLWYSGGNRSIAVPFVRLRRRFRTQTPVDILTGCALVVPIQTWMKLGGLDQRYRIYYEDFDFMMRAREAGVQALLVVEPELWVKHKVSRTTLSQGRWNREYKMIKSRLLFIRSRYSGIERILCIILSIPHFLLMAFLNLPELPSPRLLILAFTKGWKLDAKDQ